jgi:hypothetical protein
MTPVRLFMTPVQLQYDFYLTYKVNEKFLKRLLVELFGVVDYSLFDEFA